MTSGGRTKNRRGEGSLLRDEIVAGAVHILETTGREDAVTLRAIAREIGIAAPSIYSHFRDRDEILLAAAGESFRKLMEWLREALVGIEDPVTRLRISCTTYVRFAAAHPQRYRLMFGRSPAGGGEAGATINMPPEALIALDSLTTAIRACVAAGRSSSEDPFRDAVALWTCLHGLVTLACTDGPGFPTTEELTDTFVARIAQVA